jgi:hypothetical protein
MPRQSALSLPTLYKGAGPGTHWHSNDARLSGFTSAASSVANRNAVVRHIVAYSHPSPLVSLTSSFAVAREYALSGPAGLATKGAPGFVYEIDLSVVSESSLLDPLFMVVKGGALSHMHSGAQSLILAVAQNLPFAPCHHAGGKSLPPAVPQELRALVYALRDAEVLAPVVPSACVVNRHNVH